MTARSYLDVARRRLADLRRRQAAEPAVPPSTATGVATHASDYEIDELTTMVTVDALAAPPMTLPGNRASRYEIDELHEIRPVVAGETRLHPCPDCDKQVPLSWDKCAVCDPGWREGHDEFADLRRRLATGELRGYGELGLEDGTTVLQVEGYCRALVAELQWPQLARNASRHLRLLRRALAGIDHLGTGA
jgi:hypothetical protein